MTEAPTLTRELAHRLAKRIVEPTGSDKPHYLDDLSLPLGERIIRWIESEFYIPELNGTMVLYPYQKAVLREALRQDVDGKFVYDFVLWSDIKKSAKSSIAAAVVLFLALHTEWGSFKIVANDLKQADSRVFFYIRRAIELNPRLSANIRNYKISLNNHAVIEAIPVDPDGEAGGNDDMIEYTELHAFAGKAALKLWTETTISPTKFGFSQRWADTYAGISGESPILEPIYERVCKAENRVDVGIDGLEVYAQGKILALWNTIPRLPWQTKEYYASEAEILLPNENLRIHHNQWVTSTTAFVPGEWWDACLAPLPALDKYKEITVGIDAGVSDDCFGIVAVSRHGDRIVPRFVRKWIPPVGGKLQYSNPDDPDDTEYPEGALRWLARTFNVIVFGYDEYQLHHLCNGLRADGVGLFQPFNQGADRLEADKALYDLIRDRRVVHDGNADLTEHVKNANQKADPESRRLRLVKRSHKLKIDLAVCLSTAAHLAYKYLPE